MKRWDDAKSHSEVQTHKKVSSFHVKKDKYGDCFFSEKQKKDYGHYQGFSRGHPP
jgi:hypothetical protein